VGGGAVYLLGRVAYAIGYSTGGCHFMLLLSSLFSCYYIYSSIDS